MKNKAYGFTIVELLVVVVVLVILALISTIAFSGYQNQTRVNAFETTARLIAGSQTKYYEQNGEYVSSREMVNGNGSGSAMTDAQYQALSLQIGVSTDALTNTQLKFTPTVGAIGVFSPSEKNRVFMMTKDTDNGSVYKFNIATTGCTVEFPVDTSQLNIGTTAYAITYFHPTKNRWIIYGSSKGNVIVTSTGSPSQSCVFDSRL